MSRAHRKLIAWIAAAALLFSALSPAMAGVLFAQRPDILGRVLGLSVQHATTQPAAQHDDGCPHEVQTAAAALHHGAGSPQADDTSDHAAHGIYCSFCLAAGSLVGMLHAPASHVAPFSSGAVFIPAVAVQPPAANLRLTRHPRDPPSCPVLS
jgi:hypothetical protein